MQQGETVDLDHHKVMCGDARKDLTKFIEDEDVKLILSDPPYGVNRMRGHTKMNDRKRGITISDKTDGQVGNSKDFPTYMGDDTDFDPSPIINLNKPTLLFGGNYFHDKLPNGKKWYVWFKRPDIKTNNTGSWSDCELIWSNLKGYQLQCLHHVWWGMIRSGERRLELMERVHPTQKPVTLLMKLLELHSEPGDTILDPYGGGGSTLIACAETGRRCLTMEIMPEYCERIINRYNQYKDETIKKYGNFNNYLLT